MLITMSDAFALAIIITSRVHSIYMTGATDIEGPGDAWYQGHVDYTIRFGILATDDLDYYTREATRAGAAAIISCVILPDTGINGEKYG